MGKNFARGDRNCRNFPPLGVWDEKLANGKLVDVSQTKTELSERIYVMTEQQQTQEANQIEDLQILETEASEVKGGPIYMKLDGIPGDVVDAHVANGRIPQTREHILL